MTEDDKTKMDNVFKLVGTEQAQDVPPINDYEVTDIDGDVHLAEGFLIFTAQHVAIMRDDGHGAVPVLVMPLNQLKIAQLSEEIED